jgi:hypothetical protein
MNSSKVIKVVKFNSNSQSGQKVAGKKAAESKNIELVKSSQIHNNGQNVNFNGQSEQISEIEKHSATESSSQDAQKNLKKVLNLIEIDVEGEKRKFKKIDQLILNENEIYG